MPPAAQQGCRALRQGPDLAPRDERLELVVQINGKTRGKLNVARDISQDDAVALALAEG